MSVSSGPYVDEYTSPRQGIFNSLTSSVPDLSPTSMSEPPTKQQILFLGLLGQLRSRYGCLLYIARFVVEERARYRFPHERADREFVLFLFFSV
jgi:hypothetical protein